MKYDRRRLGKNESRECLKVSVDEAVNGSEELIRARLLTPLLNYLLTYSYLYCISTACYAGHVQLNA